MTRVAHATIVAYHMTVSRGTVFKCRRRNLFAHGANQLTACPIPPVCPRTDVDTPPLYLRVYLYKCTDPSIAQAYNTVIAVEKIIWYGYTKNGFCDGTFCVMMLGLMEPL